MCKRVEEFRVGCQSRNEKAFEEFSEGVVEIYASSRMLGLRVEFLLKTDSGIHKRIL